MRPLGWIIAALGLCYVVVAFNMDVSISTSGTYVPGYGNIGGGDVVNLDLMARRQNHLIFASLITLVGVLIGLFAPTKPDDRGEPERPEPKPTPFAGERDLTQDGYRLWLAKTYEISKNEVLGRFVVGEATYHSLDEALARAHALDAERLAEVEAERQRRQEAHEEYQRRVQLAEEQAAADWENRSP